MTIDFMDDSDSSGGMPKMDYGFGGQGAYNPVSELMRAIILRVVDDYNSEGELHQDAVEYLHDEDEEYIFSFLSICKTLGFDPEKTRQSIMNPAKKISTRRRAA